MRWIPLFVLFLTLTASAQAPKEPEPVPDRFGIPHKPKTYSQATPKETLTAVIEAASAGRADYIVAHLIDPGFIDTKIAERARLLESGIEAELIALRNAQRSRPVGISTQERLPDDPKAFHTAVQQRAIDRAAKLVVADVQRRISEDPESLKLLRRFNREGTFSDQDPTATVTLPNVKDHVVYFKKIGDRWFMENRYTEAPMPPAAAP